MKSGCNILKQVFELTFVNVLFLEVMALFFFFKAVELVQLSKTWKMVLFTVSSFGKETKFYLVASPVTGSQDHLNVIASRMVPGQEISLRVLY